MNQSNVDERLSDLWPPRIVYSEYDPVLRTIEHNQPRLFSRTGKCTTGNGVICTEYVYEYSVLCTREIKSHLPRVCRHSVVSPRVLSVAHLGTGSDDATSYIPSLWRFSDIKSGKGSFMTEVEMINKTGLITSLKKA